MAHQAKGKPPGNPAFLRSCFLAVQRDAQRDHTRGSPPSPHDIPSERYPAFLLSCFLTLQHGAQRDPTRGLGRTPRHPVGAVSVFPAFLLSDSPARRSARPHTRSPPSRVASRRNGIPLSCFLAFLLSCFPAFHRGARHGSPHEVSAVPPQHPVGAISASRLSSSPARRLDAAPHRAPPSRAASRRSGIRLSCLPSFLLSCFLALQHGPTRGLGRPPAASRRSGIRLSCFLALRGLGHPPAASRRSGIRLSCFLAFLLSGSPARPHTRSRPSRAASRRSGIRLSCFPAFLLSDSPA